MLMEQFLLHKKGLFSLTSQWVNSKFELQIPSKAANEIIQMFVSKDFGAEKEEQAVATFVQSLDTKNTEELDLPTYAQKIFQENFLFLLKIWVGFVSAQPP
mmetsp:Transcript_18757/g.28820  ORF Transcript_18757/g.28820 Transcript_18757/m.28820 type:complete len:101 (-) Transcript_18757:540-842(-)